MSTGANVQDLFRDIENYIAQSMAFLAQGQIMELNGLDQQVHALCLEVVRLSDDERELHAERMQAMVASLSRLAEALQTQKDLVATELNQSHVARKASIAYKQADSRDNFGNKAEE
jgi:hypothetical protein